MKNVLVNLLLWPVWPLVTCCLLSTFAPEYQRWGSTPLPYGWFFGAMSLVGWSIIFMESLMQGRLNIEDPFDERANEAKETGDEKAVTLKRLKGALVVSAAFVAFEIWLYVPSLLSSRASTQRFLVDDGLAYCLTYVLLIMAPPFVWFGLNGWRLRRVTQEKTAPFF